MDSVLSVAGAGQEVDPLHPVLFPQQKAELSHGGRARSGLARAGRCCHWR